MTEILGCDGVLLILMAIGWVILAAADKLLS